MRKQNDIVLEINGRQQKVAGLTDEVMKLLSSDKYGSGSYNIKDYSDHSWQLPNTPFQMEFELEQLHPDDKELIQTELGLEDQDFERLDLYVERTKGGIDYITINDVHYETIEDLPASIIKFLDGMIFGDPADPISVSSGERVTFWDAVKGASETQQAFYDSGYDNSEVGLTLYGEFDVRHALHDLDSAQEKRLAETMSIGATKVEISVKGGKKTRNNSLLRRLLKIALVLAVIAIVAIIGVVVFKI